ncbi:MAG: autotransporter-associated beta strand repeat-containing protein, partial [Solirubrobacteraceae bacterium]
MSISNTTMIFPVNLNTPNINLTGTLTTRGTTNVINITSVPGMTYPSNITLIKYGSADPNLVDLNNNLTTLGVTFSAPGHPVGYLTNNTTYPYSIQLVLLSGPAAIVPITWTGETNGVNAGNWDILLTSNWVTTIDGVTPYFYQDGSAVTLDDTATGTTTVNLTGTLSPASLTVSNASKVYTLSGSGNISGATSLVKTNSGTLIVDNSGVNNYSGGNLIGSGTLQLGNNDANGSLPGAITNNGSLVFNRSDSALVVSSVISGTGNVANNGSGTVTLSANAEAYSGATTVNGGILALANTGGNSNGLYSSSSLTINNGATVQVNNDNALAGSTSPIGSLPVIINNGGTLTGLGTADSGAGTSGHIRGRLTLNGGTLAMGGTSINTTYGTWNLDDGVATVGGPVASTISALNVVPTQSGGTIFNVTNGGTANGIDLNVTGSLINGTSAHDTGIFLTGGGTMALAGANTYTNWTSINAGALEVTGSGVLGGGTYAGAITNNGTFYYNSSAQTILSGVMSGTGTLIKDNTGTLQLSSANTFVGSIFVTNGTLRANNAGAFNKNPITETANGAELYLNAAGTYGSTYSIIGFGGLESDNTSHLGAIRMATANVVLTNTITLTGDAGITSRGSSTTGGTIAGQITGNYAIRFNRTSTTNSAGTGTIILSNITANANNWTGNTTNADGTLKLGASGQIPNGAGYGNFIMTTPGAAYVLGGAIAPTIFDLNGINQTLNGLSSDPNVTGSDLNLLVITNGGGSPVTLTVGNNNATGNYGGLI